MRELAHQPLTLFASPLSRRKKAPRPPNPGTLPLSLRSLFFCQGDGNGRRKPSFFKEENFDDRYVPSSFSSEYKLDEGEAEPECDESKEGAVQQVSTTKFMKMSYLPPVYFPPALVHSLRIRSWH